MPYFEALVGDGDAVQGHGVRPTSHLADLDGSRDLSAFFDVAQVDGVVEQEHQPFQGVAGQSVDAGLAGEKQGAALRPDQSDETAQVSGETILLASGERQLGQAVDDDAPDLVPADLRAHGGGEDIEIQATIGT